MTRPTNTPPRRVAVVTGSRAEFGLLRSTLDAIADQPRLQRQLVVAGAHFLAATDADIKAAGYRIDARVRMQRPGESGRSADAEALGRGVRGFAKAFDRLQPDVVLVLGDRIEAFAAAAAASVAGLRVAHLHGGDRAQGVADEAMRHAITKLAHLHFPATTNSRQRILRMGEHPEHVFRVGSPAVDGLQDIAAPREPANELIVLYHPVGRDDDAEQRDMAAILRATRRPSHADAKPASTAMSGRRVILEPNHDPGRDGILAAIDDERRHHPDLHVLAHLPRDRFLARLRDARAIVGNSSAGLIEAAVLGTPCVNVGPRQAGRERPPNVIDTPPTITALRHAIRQATAQRHAISNTPPRHPYGRPGVGQRIAQRLAELDLADVPIHKRNRY